MYIYIYIYIYILLESNPLTSKLLVGGLGVLHVKLLIYLCTHTYITHFGRVMMLLSIIRTILIMLLSLLSYDYHVKNTNNCGRVMHNNNNENKHNDNSNNHDNTNDDNDTSNDKTHNRDDNETNDNKGHTYYYHYCLYFGLCHAMLLLPLLLFWDMSCCATLCYSVLCYVVL